jgi:hypothetical protein
MSRTILLALERGQNTAKLLRNLEKVVEPGDRIVFLIEYRPDVPSCLLAQVVLLQTGVENGVACEERKARLGWDEQIAWAEKNIARDARREYGSIGVEVAVDIYCGSLNRRVRRYRDNEEVTLIYPGSAPRLRRIKILPAGVKNWFVRRRRYHPPVSLMDN